MTGPWPNNNLAGKRNSTYSRNGCIQCKESHKKCDERKPQCLKCLKQHRICHYKQKVNFKKTTDYSSQISSKWSSIPNIVDIKIIDKNDNLIHSVSSNGKCEIGQSTTVTKNDQISPLLFFPKVHMHLKDILNFDVDLASLNNDKSSSKESEEKLLTIIDSWREISWEQSFEIIKSCDPIEGFVDHLQFQQRSDLILDFDNTNIGKFIAIVGQWYFLITFCPMFSLEEAKSMINCVNHFATKFPVVETTLRFVVASYLTNIYEIRNMKSRSTFWNLNMRLPIFKLCINAVEKALAEEANGHFEKNIALAFSLVILFPFNCQESKSEWRIHLRHLNNIFSQINQIESNSTVNVDHPGNSIFNMLKSWLACAEISAAINTDHGGALNKKVDTLQSLDTSFVIVDVPFTEQVNLMTGYSTETHMLLKKMAIKITDFNVKQMKMSGSHIIKKRFESHEKIAMNNFHDLYLDLLSGINDAKQEALDNKFWASASEIDPAFKVKDHRLICSFENNDLLMRLCIELYAKYFLYTNEDDELCEIVQILNKMLQTWHSIPYAEYSLTLFISPIFYSALVSIMIGNCQLESQFLEILHQISNRGSIIASLHTKKLAFIKKVLTNKKYGSLIDPNHDQFG